jgi:hypothetical protein
MKTYASGSKPRFDGGGSEFGDMHRELPAGFGMFDIDKMKATATVELEITKQNVAFIEYRTIWNSDRNEIDWKALFEIKYRDGRSVQDALMVRKGTPTWAQLNLANTLGARYFIVVATEGGAPFTFYEVEPDGYAVEAGVLDYDDYNRTEQVERFWRYIGLYD